MAYHVEEYGLFGVDGLLGELVVFDDEIPLSGVQGDRFSSPP